MENNQIKELTNDELLEIYKNIENYIEELDKEIQKVNENE